MERVLVTGATGLIGAEVVRQLADEGAAVRVLVRRPHRGALLNGVPLELVRGDLTRPASLRRAVAGVDTVVHLAARATMEPAHVLWPTVVDGTRALARAAAAAGVAHVTYASSLLVHGPATLEAPVDGATPVDPQVGYGRAKVAAESVLAEVRDGSSMTIGALRLPHVYGPGDLLFQRMRRGWLATPGRGDNHYAHLHVEDAGRVLVAASRARWEGASACADDQPATWRRFFGVVAQHDAHLRHVAVPAPLARAGASVVAALDPRPGPSMISPDTVTGWNLPQPVRARAVWEDLGIAPRYPSIETGIPAVLDGMIRYRWRHPVDDHRR